MNDENTLASDTQTADANASTTKGGRYERGGLVFYPFRFNTPAFATSFANRYTKMMSIVHGDDDLLWVVTPVVAERLARMGYEVVG